MLEPDERGLRSYRIPVCIRGVTAPDATRISILDRVRFTATYIPVTRGVLCGQPSQIMSGRRWHEALVKHCASARRYRGFARTAVTASLDL